MFLHPRTSNVFILTNFYRRHKFLSFWRDDHYYIYMYKYKKAFQGPFFETNGRKKGRSACIVRKQVLSNLCRNKTVGIFVRWSKINLSFVSYSVLAREMARNKQPKINQTILRENNCFMYRKPIGRRKLRIGGFLPDIH